MGKRREVLGFTLQAESSSNEPSFRSRNLAAKNGREEQLSPSHTIPPNYRLNLEDLVCNFDQTPPKFTASTINLTTSPGNNPHREGLSSHESESRLYKKESLFTSGSTELDSHIQNLGLDNLSLSAKTLSRASAGTSGKQATSCANQPRATLQDRRNMLRQLRQASSFVQSSLPDE